MIANKQTSKQTDKQTKNKDRNTPLTRNVGRSFPEETPKSFLFF